MTARLNAAAKTARTIVQVLASAGFLAGINAALGSAGTVLPGNAKAAVLAALVPVVTLAHNALEDHGVIGTWLRQPTLTPAAIVKQARKARDAAAREAAKAKGKLVADMPALASIADLVQAKIDESLAAVTARVEEIAGQLPQMPAAPQVTQVQTWPSGPATFLSPSAPAPEPPAGPAPPAG